MDISIYLPQVIEITVGMSRSLNGKRHDEKFIPDNAGWGVAGL